MQWGPAADAKLFMHTLRIHAVKLDYQALAQALGDDVTPKAIQHRIAKLKEMAKAEQPDITLPMPGPRRGKPKNTTPGHKSASNAGTGVGTGNGRKRPASAPTKQINRNNVTNGTPNKRTVQQMMMMQGSPYEDTDGDDSSSDDDEEERNFYNNNNNNYKKEEDIKPMAKKLKTGAATDGTPTKSYVVAAAAVNGNGSPSDDGNMKSRLLGLTEEEMAAGYFADGTEVGDFEFVV